MFARLFKLTEDYIDVYNPVRLDISLNGNKTEIIKIFSSNMDSSNVRRNLRFWRKKSFYEFNWIVPFYESFELMVHDFQNVTYFAKNIAALVNNDSITHAGHSNHPWTSMDDGMPVVQDQTEKKAIGLSEPAKVSIDSFFDSLYEAFDAIDIFFGNRREIPYVLDELLLAFDQLDLKRILMGAELKFELIDMFNGFVTDQNTHNRQDPNGWDEVVSFFENEFQFTSSDCEVMSHIRVEFSKLFAGSNDGDDGDNSTTLLCDPNKLSSFLISPGAPFVDDDGPNLQTIDAKLCNITTVEKWSLIPVLYEELRIEDFLNMYLKIDIHTILEASNVTEEEAENAFKAIKAGSEAYETMTDNFSRLSNLFSNSSKEYENQTMVEATSSFMCGDKDEFMIGNHNLGEIFDDVANLDNVSLETGLSRNGAEYRIDRGWNKGLIDYASKEDACSAFMQTLMESTEGNFLWGFVGHIVKGKILYSPSNYFTQTIVDEINKTFLEIDQNIDRITSYASFGGQLDSLRTMQNELEILQDLCTNSTIRQMLIDNGVNETQIEFITDIDVREFIEVLEENRAMYTSDLQLFTNFLACISTTDRMMGMDNETEILDWAVNATKISGDSVFAGLVFMEEGNYTKHVKYKLRMEKGKHANTYKLKSPYYIAGPESGFLGNLGYLVGFIQMQELIDRAIMKTIETDILSENSDTFYEYMGSFSHSRDDTSIQRPTANEASDSNPKSLLDLQAIGIFTQEFPFPCYTVDWFLNQVYLANILQMCLLFGYLAFIISNTRQQLWEKESQNSDIMQAMGMQPRVIWLVWSLMCLISIVIITSVLTLMFKYGPFLPRSNPIIVWIVLFIAGISIIMYSFMMCAIMTRTAIGSILTAIGYVCSFIPYIILLMMKVISYYVVS